MLLSQTISIDYKLIPNLVFAELCGTLHFGLPTGPYRDTTNPTVDEYGTMLVNFKTAVSAMTTGLNAATLERDRTLTLLEEGTRNLSAFAIRTTPGRPDQWVEAGFPLTKGATTPRTPSQPVTGFELKDGNAERSILAGCDVQPGMYGYLWRIRPKNGPSGRFCYETYVSREASVLITGLDSETAYCVECAPWNNTGPLQWSPALSRIVQ